MKKLVNLIMMVFVVSAMSAKNNPETTNSGISIDKVYLLHQKIGCTELSFDAFRTAYAAQQTMISKFDNDSILTVVDFSKPSTEERFFVIDIKNGNLLIKTLVAHGRNSGDLYAERFSNTVSSLQSSLGLFRTGTTYVGKHGNSLLLDGLQKGLNDKARERAVVIHSADYVSPVYAKNNGRLGRSFGCPALSNDMNDKVISIIKNGSCLFLYHPSHNLLADK